MVEVLRWVGGAVFIVAMFVGARILSRKLDKWDERTADAYEDGEYDDERGEDDES